MFLTLEQVTKYADAFYSMLLKIEELSSAITEGLNLRTFSCSFSPVKCRKVLILLVCLVE
jgi:hypothetical protein